MAGGQSGQDADIDGTQVFDAQIQGTPARVTDRGDQDRALRGVLDNFRAGMGQDGIGQCARTGQFQHPGILEIFVQFHGRRTNRSGVEREGTGAAFDPFGFVGESGRCQGQGALTGGELAVVREEIDRQRAGGAKRAAIECDSAIVREGSGTFQNAVGKANFRRTRMGEMFGIRDDEMAFVDGDSPTTGYARIRADRQRSVDLKSLPGGDVDRAVTAVESIGAAFQLRVLIDIEQALVDEMSVEVVVFRRQAVLRRRMKRSGDGQGIVECVQIGVGNRAASAVQTNDAAQRHIRPDVQVGIDTVAQDIQSALGVVEIAGEYGERTTVHRFQNAIVDELRRG